MQIISLNAWGGTIFEPLMDFIVRMAAETDVFCFQEIMRATQPGITETTRGARANLLQEISTRLPEFDAYFAVAQERVDILENPQANVETGIATFVKKNLAVMEHGEFFVYRGYNTYVPGDSTTLGRNALWIALETAGGPLTICQAHGTAWPGDKRDSPDRLAQSQKILDTLKPRDGEKIVMGDFNLFPDTESIRMFERAGYRNLIKDYGISSTRGTLMKQLNPQYANSEFGYQEFADYTFVTPGITVKSFDVPDLPISDHLPMVLRIA